MLFLVEVNQTSGLLVFRIHRRCLFLFSFEEKRAESSASKRGYLISLDFELVDVLLVLRCD